MKNRYLRFLDHLSKTAKPPQGPPPPKPPRKSRHQRRADALFNRKLAERLKKDQLPMSMEVLPDGGLHVKVDGRTEEKKERQAAAKEKSDDKEV